MPLRSTDLVIQSFLDSLYMNQVPNAPTPFDNSGTANCTAANNLYTYAVTGGASQTYTLTYCLGNATGGVAAGLGTATPAGIK